MIKTSILAVALCAAFAQQASAQPVVHDHRKPAAKPKKPVVHDHRKPAAKPAPKRKRPVVHDHRKPAAKPAPPVVHDHRKPAAKPVHDRSKHDKYRHKRKPPATTVVAPLPTPPEAVGQPHPGSRPDRRRRWRSYEIPVVSGYWPAKGNLGTEVTINGSNFKPNLKVYLGEIEISGATITPDSIRFQIPQSAADGMIIVRGGGKRAAFAVGHFEVAKFDAKAARKKRRELRHKTAKASWKQRRKGFAKDKAARLQAMQAYEAELVTSRDVRRAARLSEIRAEFKATFLADEATQAELALHAERLARLQRMMRLAETNDSGELAVRIDVAIVQENDRHQSRMTTLEAAFQVP